MQELDYGFHGVREKELTVAPSAVVPAQYWGCQLDLVLNRARIALYNRRHGDDYRDRLLQFSLTALISSSAIDCLRWCSCNAWTGPRDVVKVILSALREYTIGRGHHRDGVADLGYVNGSKARVVGTLALLVRHSRRCEAGMDSIQVAEQLVSPS